MIEKWYDHNFEETAAAWDELPKLKAYLEAVGTDQSLDEKEKMARVQAVLFGPRRRKTQADGTGPPKNGKLSEQCSLMFAYVRLIWKKFSRRRPRSLAAEPA